MTPNPEAFWCERFSKHRDNEDSILTPREAAIAADLDLEEFRKRFGGGDEVKPDKLDIAADIMDRKNQTSKTKLYPWPLLPEYIAFCSTDGNGRSVAWQSGMMPKINEGNKEWDNNSRMWEYFDRYGLDDVPTPDWRTSLEARPKK